MVVLSGILSVVASKVASRSAEVVVLRVFSSVKGFPGMETVNFSVASSTGSILSSSASERSLIELSIMTYFNIPGNCVVISTLGLPPAPSLTF